MEKWNEVKSKRLTPEEIETLIAKEFGNKIRPVNKQELAKKRRFTESFRTRTKDEGRQIFGG